MEEAVRWKMDGRSKNIVLGLICYSVVTVGVLSFGAGVLGIRVNTSYSLPLGLYIRTNDSDARLIEFCPVGSFARQSSERGYRGASFACADGAVPLLKPIVAREGDLVETTPAGIRVNGVLLPQTAPLVRDGHSWPLTAWPFGAYRVQPGTVWVASTYNRGSYDSRYMGPIALSQTCRRLKPLWVL
jgi:conjugative transfer signal peptidase TraF